MGGYEPHSSGFLSFFKSSKKSLDRDLQANNHSEDFLRKPKVKLGLTN